MIGLKKKDIIGWISAGIERRKTHLFYAKLLEDCSSNCLRLVSPHITAALWSVSVNVPSSDLLLAVLFLSAAAVCFLHVTRLVIRHESDTM